MQSEDSPEMARFNGALKDVLSVSKDDLKRLLAKDKKKKADQHETKGSRASL